MRRADLVRLSSDDEGTLGVLRLPGADGDPLRTIEPPWRDNLRNRSCIPAGLYDVLPHVSPRFGRCLLVSGVRERSHILFHAGNVGGDVEVGYHTHTLGCVLPGLRHGRLDVKGRRQRAVLSSRTAFRHLLAWANGDPFRLEIHSGIVS